MYDVSAQGVDERMMNVRYYYYYSSVVAAVQTFSFCLLFRLKYFHVKAVLISGSMNNDYGYRFNGKTSKMNNYTATGISNAVLGSRLSYVYNLTGPCMVLDTACSASLVAIHQGCLAIHSGELLVVGLSLLYTRAVWPSTALS